jgi:hypothetical protein
MNTEVFINESSFLIVGEEIAIKLLYLLFTKLLELLWFTFDLLRPGLEEPADRFVVCFGLELLLL